MCTWYSCFTGSEGGGLEDAHHAGRVTQRPDVCQEPVLNHVHRAAARQPLYERLVGGAAGGDEGLDRQDPRRQRLLDDVLTLGQELPQLAASAGGLEPAGVLQARVLA